MLASKKVALLSGKRVLEARPAGAWNKGAVVARLLRQPWACGRVPVYFGDDRMDFDAVRGVLNQGLGVRVRGRRDITGENARISDPDRLETLAHWLSVKVRDLERDVR